MFTSRPVLLKWQYFVISISDEDNLDGVKEAYTNYVQRIIKSQFFLYFFFEKLGKCLNQLRVLHQLHTKTAKARGQSLGWWSINRECFIRILCIFSYLDWSSFQSRSQYIWYLLTLFLLKIRPYFLLKLNKDGLADKYLCNAAYS